MKLHHKTPISFVLMLLLNIVLIVVFELLALYRFPAPPAAELLERLDNRYEDCHVYSDTNLTMDRGVRFYLVETRNGEKDIIPMRQHDFFPSRSRLQKGKIIRDLDLSRDSDQQLLIGTNLYRIVVYDGRVQAMLSTGSSFQQTALAKYMGLGGLLAFMEMLIWEKIRGNL